MSASVVIYIPPHLPLPAMGDAFYAFSRGVGYGTAAYMAYRLYKHYQADIYAYGYHWVGYQRSCKSAVAPNPSCGFETSHRMTNTPNGCTSTVPSCGGYISVPSDGSPTAIRPYFNLTYRRVGNAQRFFDEAWSLKSGVAFASVPVPSMSNAVKYAIPIPEFVPYPRPGAIALNPNLARALARPNAPSAVPEAIPFPIDLDPFDFKVVHTWPPAVTAPSSRSSPRPSTAPVVVPHVPPHQRKPPRKNKEKEKKVRSKNPGVWAFGFLDKLSESAEVVSAIYDALPDDVKKRWSKGRPKRGADAMGQYGIDGADWKLQALWYNWDKVDAAQAVQNIATNELEDKVYGAAFGAQDKLTGRGKDGFKWLTGRNGSARSFR